MTLHEPQPGYPSSVSGAGYNRKRTRPSNLGVTSVYLDGIDTAEIIDTGHNRRPPMISASAGLRI